MTYRSSLGFMQNLTSAAQQVDRRIKGILRTADPESLTKTQRETVKRIRLACNEIKLDIRDYEYAETRADQEKWLKIGVHNIKALETSMLQLTDIFGPADVAELSAQLQMIQSNMK